MNRGISLELLVHFAKMTNRQFIFMTPLDISSYVNTAVATVCLCMIFYIFSFSTLFPIYSSYSVKPELNVIKILRLQDPIRNQGTLAFGHQAEVAASDDENE